MITVDPPNDNGVFSLSLFISGVLVIILLCKSFSYPKKSKGLKNRGIVLSLWTLLIVLTPIMIFILPLVTLRWGGYTFATVTLTYDLGIIVCLFIAINSIVNSKGGKYLTES
ncbi:MAG: hypothetical protein ACFE96_15805 [Candidatus Hermodarchaeota archaeon]